MAQTVIYDAIAHHPAHRVEFLSGLVEQQRGRERVDVQVGVALVIDHYLLNTTQNRVICRFRHGLKDGVGPLRMSAHS